jgi:hypothetical protein
MRAHGEMRSCERRWPRRRVVVELAVTLVMASGIACATSRASAQSLTPGGFEIDVHNGPVLGSSRMIGLGGAYSAVAADVSGVAWNPASYASRELWETSWFAWDVSAGILLPTTTSSRGDFDNNGDASVGYGGFLYGDLALGVQFGAFGLGVLLRSFAYEARVGDQNVSVGLTTANYGLGYGFLDGQIVVGGGARTASFTVRTGGEALLQLAGTAPEIGTQIRLAGRPWRIGAAYRAGLSVDYEPTGAAAAIARPRPRAAHLPWELQLGVAYQFGDRPLNRRFIDPGRAEAALTARYAARRRERVREQLRRERAAGRPVGTEPTDPRWLNEEAERVVAEDAELERDLAYASLRRVAELRALSRRYVLVTGEVVVTGATQDGVGLEGYLWGRPDPAGRNVTTSVRLGVELEPWFERIKLRVGGYFEPSRFVGVAGRMHATAGVDVRLGEWDVFGLSPNTSWRLSLVGDVARRYFDWGLGIGVWH